MRRNSFWDRKLLIVSLNNCFPTIMLCFSNIILKMSPAGNLVFLSSKHSLVVYTPLYTHPQMVHWLDQKLMVLSTTSCKQHMEMVKRAKYFDNRTP